MTIFATALRNELNTTKETVATLTKEVTALKAENQDLKSKTTDVAEISTTYHTEKETWEKSTATLKADNAKNVETLTKDFTAKLDTLNTQVASLVAEKEALSKQLSTKAEVDKASVEEEVLKRLAIKMSGMALKENAIPSEPTVPQREQIMAQIKALRQSNKHNDADLLWKANRELFV